MGGVSVTASSLAGDRSGAASSPRRSPPLEPGWASSRCCSRWPPLAWWSTADRMAGMDAGPGTDLGALGWFLGVWVVMMAAMMFPSLAPTAALYAQDDARRGLVRPLLFTAAICSSGGCRAGRVRAVPNSARASSVATRVARRRAVVRRRCVGRRGALRADAAEGRLPGEVPQPARFPARHLARRSAGALEMGAGTPAWCLGCCWALMAALFALGVMSLTWMAFVAALIALEKTCPGGGS